MLNRLPDYQPKYFKFTLWWLVLHSFCFCLAKKFLKRCFLLNSFMKLSPVFNKQSTFSKELTGAWSPVRTSRKSKANFCALHLEERRVSIIASTKFASHSCEVRTELSPEPKPNSFLKGKCNKCCQIYLNLEKNSQICRVGFWLNLLQAPLYDVSKFCHRIYRCCSILNLE